MTNAMKLKTKYNLAAAVGMAALSLSASITGLRLSLIATCPR